MLLEKKGEFFERVALGGSLTGSDVSVTRVNEYPEKTGLPQHVKLR